jgi:hypothetical protein
MLKIKSIDDGVPDFYTSPYLVRTIFATGSDQEKEVTVDDKCNFFLDDGYVKTDTKWRSTIVLQIIGVAWGACLWVGLLLSLCLSCPGCCHRASGCGWIFICTLFTGLSFLILDSKLCTNNPVLKELEIQDMYEDDCEIASGSIMLIIGIAGLFLTGVTTCAISGKDEPRKEKKKKQDEDEKDEEEPTKNDPEPEEPVEELEPEPESEPEAEPEPVEEADTELAEKPEPTEERDFDETAEEGKLNRSSKITDSKITSSGVWIAD